MAKYGRSLNELAAEVVRRRDHKKDFVVQTNALKMLADSEEVAVEFGDFMFGVNDHAHLQLAQYTGIYKPYYDKMKNEAPELLAANVNEWLTRTAEPRMLRCLDGNLRGFLSEKYRPLDNDMLLEAILPPLQAAGAQIISCDVTDSKLYIKAVDERIKNDIPAGKAMGDGSHTIFDTVCPAITISNSEVGTGSLSVQTSIFTKACTNLATFGDRSLRKAHLGGAAIDLGENLYAMLSDQTKRLTDAALWAQARDVVTNAFNEAKFNGLCGELRNANAAKIEGDPVKVVELTAKKIGANDNERSSILRHLIEGGNLSQYGLFNAITRTAEDLSSYDRATEFERFGGQIIELPKNEIQAILKAA